jgi:hypothetical protein
MKRTNNYKNRKKACKSKKQVNCELVYLLSIFHLVHNDIVNPKNNDGVEVVRGSTKIKFAAEPKDTRAHPERPSIFVNELEKRQEIITQRSN